MGKTLGYGEITVANMTEPFTVMLTNEAQQFATDSNRKVTSAQSYYTDIIVIRGSQERTDYTIGNITSGSGITVSKNSKRVTFSVSAGTTIGADAGVIEIPITLDGQTVKKQFSWSCGKQGPQGVKGDPGTSVKITSKSVTYQTSTSGTTAPTGTWSTTVPMVNNGQYLWTKTTVQYSDGNKTEAYSVSYKGTNGTNGTSVTVSKTEVTYQVSTSGTTAPTGTWSTTMPSCDQGQYLWTKTYVKYSDGKETTSYSVSYKGVDGEKFSWNLIQNGKGNEKRGFFKNFSSVNITEGYGEITLTSKHNYIGIGLSGFVLTPRQYEVGKKVTWSYDIMYTKWDFPTGTNHQEFWLGQRYTNAPSGETATGQWVGVTAHDLPVVGQNGCELNKWFHVEVTKTIPTQASSNVGHQEVINFYNSTDISATVTFRMKNVKLEYGDTATPWSPSQSDIEGRGVAETVQYYLAVSQASGVTSSTSGWSTDITTQKLTADKKYLWNCYQTKYSDGTSEPISTPKVIGVYGDKGQNAKNLSITPSSQYFKSTDGGKTFAPNTITIKPTIQGEINFGKWQYSIDGGVSFADVVNGQKGLTISNNVLTVSKDSSLYSDAVTMVTFRAVANDSSFYDTCSIAKIYDVSDIEIGGRNLLLNSDKEYVMGFGIPNTTWTDGYAYIGLPTTRINDEILPQNNAFLLHPEAGKTYTQTIWIETDADVIDLNAAQVSWFTGKYGHVLVAAKIIKLADNSYKLTSTHTVTKEDSDIRLFDIMFLFSALDISNSGTYLKFGKLKVEQGNVSTDWTPAIEDVQTAILSTKSEISDVSLKVDKNKQAIEQRVEKTTYQQDLNLVKGDISKANEGLNKWRYEIYPKSLFTDKPEDQSKYDIGVFIRNKNLTPSQSVLLDDASLSTGMHYGDSHIAYGLTFIKMSAAKSITTTFYNDDGASFYVNGKLIISRASEYTNGQEITFTLVQGWNCIEVVVNEDANTEGFKLGTTLSALSECQLMNCYYGTPVARQSHITNQLVENTTNIKGVTTTMQKVMTTVGGSDRIDEFVNNYNKTIESEKQFKKTIGETYTTKDEFNGLEIGCRNLILNSAFKKGRKEWSNWGNPTTREIVSSNGKSWAHIVGNKQNYQGFKQWTPAGSIKEGDHITFSARIKGSAANQRFTVGIHWINSCNTIISQDWHTFIVDATENVYTWTVDAKESGCDKLNLMVGVSDTSAAYNVYFTEIMVVKGNKATDYTPAPEDDEINGQNLVSNLPSNWEQGSFDGSRVDVGGVYNTGKVDNSTRIRVKELVPVSGTITISNAYSNQSKKPIQHVINAFDVNKKYLGSGYIDTDWNDFPRIVDMKDAKYIAVIVRYKDESAITPSDISQICLKIERGTSATPFTLAPEDVNGKIVNVETIANQTAKKFEWIVNGGDSSSNFTLTDRVADLVAERINFNGLVTFSGLSTDAKNEIGKVAQSKVDGLEVGGRNLLTGVSSYTKDTPFEKTDSRADGWIVYQNIITSIELEAGKKYVLQAKTDGNWTANHDTNGQDPSKKLVALWLCSDTTNDFFDMRQGYAVFTPAVTAKYKLRVNQYSNGTDAYTIHLWDIKLEKGSKATDWTPAPEDYLPQADLVRNWTTNTTWIDGGKIYTGSITADKIATDAIKSRNYISSGGTQGSFLNLSDGSFQSPNLSWDANGNLIAKNANISGVIYATKGIFNGEINATTGTIGNWKIVGSTLYSSSTNSYGIGLSSDYNRYLMWAGETNRANGASESNAKLTVDRNGKLRVGGDDSGIEMYYGKIDIYNNGYDKKIGRICTIHNSDTGEYHMGLSAYYGYGWMIGHKDSNNYYVISDMYTRPNNQGVYMPRGFNVSYTDNSGGGQDGYFRIARISITGSYLNCPIELEFIRRGDHSPTKVTIRFNNSNTISPGIAEFYYEGRSNMEIYACDGITLEDNSHTLADIYVRKAEAWDNITVTNVKNSWGYMNSGLDIDTTVAFYSSKPNVTHQAENLFDSGWVNCSMGYGISAYNSDSNIRVRKKNGIVFLEGVATNSTTWTEHDNIISFREDFAPARSCSFVMQGSGSNRWLLYVQPDGVCTASRYSNNGTMSNTVPKNSWLCMNASWIAK